MTDDKRVNEIVKKYSKGILMASEIKQIMSDLVVEIIK